MTSSHEQQPGSTPEDITLGFAINSEPETVEAVTDVASPERVWSNPDVAHEADDYINWMAEHAKTPELANTYLELFDKHGDAFAAYLCIDGINQESASLAEDFRDSYLWASADETTLVEQELADLGWEEALNEFLNIQGIHEEALRWDKQFLLRLLNWTYEIVPMYGVLYVFEK